MKENELATYIDTLPTFALLVKGTHTTTQLTRYKNELRMLKSRQVGLLFHIKRMKWSLMIIILVSKN